MKITKQRLKEIIKEELNESVPVPRTWIRHAAALLSKASFHTTEVNAEQLQAISEELKQMADAWDQ